jgi:hypothetical protein
MTSVGFAGELFSTDAMNELDPVLTERRHLPFQETAGTTDAMREIWWM